MRIKRIYSTAAKRHASVVRSQWREEQQRQQQRRGTINELNTTDQNTEQTKDNDND